MISLLMCSWCEVAAAAWDVAEVPPPGFFLSATFLCDLPFRSRLKDSLSDFLKDLRLDMGLSSALAMSANQG